MKQAPDFTLPDQDGTMHSLKDYAGTWVVLYFYPKDDTPGCTAEACNFRDARGAIAEFGNASVIGISKDSVKFDKYIFVSTDISNPKAPHQFAASILDNQLAYPSIVFLNNQIQRLDVLKGFMPPKNFEPILNYYGSGDYQKTKWEEYKNTLVSTIK